MQPTDRQRVRSRHAPVVNECTVNGKRKVTQYNISQDDFPIAGSRVACTSISCVASMAFLKGKGSRKPFSTNNSVYSVLKDGVDLHHKWVQRDSRRKGVDAMAAVDEVIFEIPEAGVAVKDECIAGMLAAETPDYTCTFGLSLARALRNAFSTKAANMNPMAAYVLTTRGYSTMIGRKGTKAFIFDSHRRHAETGLALKGSERGNAIFMEFDSVEDMVSYLRQLYAFDTHQEEFFILQEIGLVEKKSQFAFVAKSLLGSLSSLKGVRATEEEFKGTVINVSV
eukprot:comp9370_c0_seq1/m.4428 comp9370_c0_seq1/g.4428  ORF comp9370_c0_seq1/g.4428 comp9370_c0_seq1/m.4428 type:complete len:282 (-) comp9370_c0_seq1:389-1234(-)